MYINLANVEILASLKMLMNPTKHLTVYILNDFSDLIYRYISTHTNVRILLQLNHVICFKIKIRNYRNTHIPNCKTN